MRLLHHRISSFWTSNLKYREYLMEIEYYILLKSDVYFQLIHKFSFEILRNLHVVTGSGSWEYIFILYQPIGFVAKNHRREKNDGGIKRVDDVISEKWYFQFSGSLRIFYSLSSLNEYQKCDENRMSNIYCGMTLLWQLNWIPPHVNVYWCFVTEWSTVDDTETFFHWWKFNKIKNENYKYYSFIKSKLTIYIWNLINILRCILK